MRSRMEASRAQGVEVQYWYNYLHGDCEILAVKEDWRRGL